MDKHYVYILKCKDNSLYTGWTTDIEKRLKAHNSGKGAKYTKSRKPVVLVYKEEFDSKSDALRREAAIKKLTREQKLELINKH
ncbi:GIY-YIG nuclease family protein [Eubacterium sp. AM05-23]|uniref:GIY-YIG nuclease family protein n=2 Tax=Eubacteriaceae TaxID=186806 RepID=A0A4P9CFN9_EUBML|nr:GIY-YIG nuclease family protein [Eubacterium maltosivorans]RHO59025.1 GIY-YIG nuclease family protein [Eubacterium sp. AM05-23]